MYILCIRDGPVSVFSVNRLPVNRSVKKKKLPVTGSVITGYRQPVINRLSPVINRLTGFPVNRLSGQPVNR